jgi:hypothetical protein
MEEVERLLPAVRVRPMIAVARIVAVVDVAVGHAIGCIVIQRKIVVSRRDKPAPVRYESVPAPAHPKGRSV